MITTTVALQFMSFLFQENGNYGDLFLYALKNLGILIIGLYRFRDTNELQTSPSSKRYVIANPMADFKLYSTDQVCLSHIFYLF